MRDGVHLSTDVYLPEGVTESVPAVFVRTPYGKEDGCEIYYRYIQRGYAVVIQDVRGRNLSEGEWLPNYYEVEDGDDTLNWNYRTDLVFRKRWNGWRLLSRLCTVGCCCQRKSAFKGINQRSLAPEAHLLIFPAAAVPLPPVCWHGPLPFPEQKKFHPELMERDDWEEVLNIRPLKDLAGKSPGLSGSILINGWKTAIIMISGAVPTGRNAQKRL